jgi:hypothetical protein
MVVWFGVGGYDAVVVSQSFNDFRLCHHSALNRSADTDE